MAKNKRLPAHSPNGSKTEAYRPSGRPLAIDLFAGAGGMSLGVEASGFDIAAAVELDPIHAATHHFNFPYAETICADMTAVESDRLERVVTKRGRDELDLLVGGPPCQGFSQIGKRQLDDPRNRLVFEYLRVVRDLRPRYFIFENVPGMNTGRHRSFVGELVDAFDDAGYVVEKPIRVLNAKDHGVAQDRRRLIIMGSRSDQPAIQYPHAGSPTDGHTLTVEEAIGDLFGIDAIVSKDFGVPMSAVEYSGRAKTLFNDHAGQYRLTHVRPVPQGKLWGHVGSHHTEKSIARFAATAPGTFEDISRFFKLSPQGLCHTLRAGTASNRGAYTAPRPIHYGIPRCITIREAARLHSYPDWFQFHRTIWHGFRQIGNSVAPLFGKALADTVTAAMGVDSKALPTYELPVESEELLWYDMGSAARHYGVSRHTIAPRRRRESEATASD